MVDFPLLEWDEEEKRYGAMHHPFTSPMDEDLAKLDSDPGAVRAKAYDLVLNGSEIGGGSTRIHDAAVQARMFDLLNISAEEQKLRFGFFLEALEYGTPPHGGIALGLDRLVRAPVERELDSRSDRVPEDGGGGRPDVERAVHREPAPASGTAFASEDIDARMKRIVLPQAGIETLYGARDANLKHVESLFSVGIRTQGDELIVTGDAADEQRVVQALRAAHRPPRRRAIRSSTAT